VLLVLALVSALVLGLVQLKLVVTPVLITVIIAAAVSPVVRSLRRRGFPSALAAWIALVTGIGTLSLIIWLVVRGFRREWDELRATAEDGFIELQRYLTGGPLGITEEQIEQARQAAADFLTSATVSSGALAGAAVAAEVVAGIFLGLVVLFFLLKDGQKIWDFLVRPLPEHSHERAHRIGARAVDVLGGYVRGTAIVALVDAVVIGVALGILGVPLALPLATIVFLGAFIPLVGATLAGIVAALVALVANGPGTMLIVVAVVIAVNQLEGDLLAPIVLGRAVRLHALAILLALTAGTILSGIIGALLAVPLTAVAWTVIREWRGPVPDDELPRPHLPHLATRAKREKAEA
jgi:predicted PurR-regulated permease PerM